MSVGVKSKHLHNTQSYNHILNFDFFTAEKTKLTVATVESGGHGTFEQKELSKGTEYYETALEATSKTNLKFVLFYDR